MSLSAYARQAQAYKRQAILTASPGQLVLMLYDGVIRFLHQAQESFAEIDSPRGIENVHHNITRAVNILAEMQSNLNMDVGGEYAENLWRLYDYYQRRLHEANMKKQPEPVAEIMGLVQELRDGWAEMLAQGGESQNAREAAKAANY